MHSMALRLDAAALQAETAASLSKSVAGYESEVEEDAAEVPGEQHIQEQKPPRKKAEPYDVPSSGAFWMHDDRMDDDELAASGCACTSVTLMHVASCGGACMSRIYERLHLTMGLVLIRIRCILSSASVGHEGTRWSFYRRGVPKQKKLFNPDGGEDVWKHDRFELLDLPPEEDDYRVWFCPLPWQPVCV